MSSMEVNWEKMSTREPRAARRGSSEASRRVFAQDSHRCSPCGSAVRSSRPSNR